MLPQDTEARQGWDLAVQEFGEGAISPVVLAVRSEDGIRTKENIANLYDLTRTLAELPGVLVVESLVNVAPELSKEQYQALYTSPSQSSVPGVTEAMERFGAGNTTTVRLTTQFDINSGEAQDLVRSIRRLQPPGGLKVYVTGASASLMDAVDAMYDDFPRAIVLVMILVYAVLLILFRSVVLPLKAIIMNGMSIFAAYGALVFIFQDGRLEGLLGFSSQGFLEATVPILLFMILFGLSMDYEVFLLTRIKEIYDKEGYNTASVALGLEKTGRIITSAALVLVLVAGSFVFADIVIIKALGLGIAIAILLDSTVVRALLVPALMRALGDWNWWAPGFLRKVLPP